MLSAFMLFSVLTVRVTYFQNAVSAGNTPAGRGLLDALLGNGFTEEPKEICEKNSKISYSRKARRRMQDTRQKQVMDDTMYSGVLWCDEVNGESTFWLRLLANG